MVAVKDGAQFAALGIPCLPLAKTVVFTLRLSGSPIASFVTFAGVVVPQAQGILVATSGCAVLLGACAATGA